MENCCQNAILQGKCSYTYISNTISMYAEPALAQVNRMSTSLKPVDNDVAATGIYKDGDDRYSLHRLLKRQEEGDGQ